MKSKVLKYLYIICIFLITSLFVSALYFKSFYASSHFEEILYSIKDGGKSADTSFIFIGIKSCLPSIIVIFTILFFLLVKKSKYKIINKIQEKKIPITWVLFGLSAVTAIWGMSIIPYTYYAHNNSDFIEENYVDPKKTEVKFNQKRNLIFITVESLETSLFTKEKGGYWDYEVIPELYNLLLDDDVVAFHNKDLAEQLNMIQGSSWTTASVISNTSGLPFKVNTSNLKHGSIMKGAYTLGDLLNDNGYYNEVISAASTSFGDLKKYFTTHGNYSIIDIESLKDYGLKMTKADEGRWGFNDNYLFKIAQERLTSIVKQTQPFNLHLITIDTHFIDGFTGEYSINKYEEKYENAYATESKLLYNFISWIKEQPFYKNTTIVVMGDHVSMQSEFFRERQAKDRYVYGCIINPAVKDVKDDNRIITSLDTFPTIISALGGKIKGEKLGLGVNLFSNQMTLAEKYGISILDKELKKNSLFYKNKINNK